MFNFLSEQFSNLFSSLSSSKKITQKHIDETLAQVKQVLLEADVPLEVANSLLQSIEQKVLGQKIISGLKPAEQLVKIINDELIALMGVKTPPFRPKNGAKILVMGLQGAGKTTTIAKLAYRLKRDAQKANKRIKIMIASVDFYRPAAIDQLEILAKKIDAYFYRASAQDPVAACQEICTHFEQRHQDILLIDTAGRLHVDDALMKELQKISAIAQPTYTFLVVDGMIGQESLSVARTFNESIGFDQAILTKMDSDTRGGVALSFFYTFKKPVLFIGQGEKVEDLVLFDVERMVGRMIGMGDIKSLIDLANEKIKDSDQDEMTRAFESGKFTYGDFAKQCGMLARMGSFASIIKYLPGQLLAGMSQKALEQGEVQVKKAQAIISSMNSKEADCLVKFSSTRKKKLAYGAGVTIADLDDFFQRFEQMKQYAKLLKGGKNKSLWPF